MAKKLKNSCACVRRNQFMANLVPDEAGIAPIKMMCAVLCIWVCAESQKRRCTTEGLGHQLYAVQPGILKPGCFPNTILKDDTHFPDHGVQLSAPIASCALQLR